MTQTVNSAESEGTVVRVEAEEEPNVPDDSPKVQDGYLTVGRNTELRGALEGSDPQGRQLTFSIVENGQKGTAVITNSTTGSFTYTPNPNEAGEDSFTFKVYNGVHDSDVATITIMIQELDDCTGTKIIYVKQGSNGSGCGWDDALGNLQDALDKAELGDEIWIAKGTYIPTGNQIEDDDPRTVHFKMKNGVTIYGGFAGDEDPETFDLGQRDFTTNETILSGKIGLDDDDIDHAYHVFYHDGGVYPTAVLDGVTITGGRAKGSESSYRQGGGMYNSSSSPTLRNVTISGNSASSGGGMYNDTSSPTLRNVTISRNSADSGGGMYNNHSSPTLTDVTISGNTAGSYGGGMYNDTSSPTLRNVTISGNSANFFGGGIYNFTSYTTIHNSIIWGNGTSGGSEENIFNSASNPVIDYSIIGLLGVTAPDGIDPDNIRIDSLFKAPKPFRNAPTTEGNYRLNQGSPAIDAGNNNLVPADVTTDRDGNPRIVGERIDLGAYEYQSEETPVPKAVEVSGAETITVPGSGKSAVTETYKAVVLDEESEEMPDEKVQWSVTSAKGVSIDPETGLLTVTDEADAGKIEVKASVKANPGVSGKLEITLKEPAVVMPKVPDPPTNLFATAGDRTVSLQWNVATGAESYTIYRYEGALAPANPVDWIEIASEIQGTGYTVIGLTNGKAYAFVVKAVNAGGASDFSNVATATPKAKPHNPDTEAPQWRENDTLTVSDITQTSVKLSWPKATDNVGVKGYRIFVDGDEHTTVSASEIATTILDLEADQEYTFEITAYDEAGNESRPLTATAKTLPDLPEPIIEPPYWLEGDELTVSDITKTSVKLSWPSAIDKVGVTGYRIFVDDDNWKPQTVSESVNEYTVRELQAGTIYRFTVKAFNAAGKQSEPLSKQATMARSSGGSGGSSGGGGSRTLSNNADLADLVVWANGQKLNLSPSFASKTTDYRARTEAEQIEIVAEEEDSEARVILKGKVVTGTIKVDLEEGDNTFVVTVQAENGTKKKYTLTIYREPLMQSETIMEFSDISGHWAESYIKRAAAKGIVSGYPGGTFKPDLPVTRVEFTAMLAGALQLKGEGILLTFADNDQIGVWANQAVAQALQAGIIGGYDDGSFRPNTQITRAEMAVMIARALRLQTNSNTSTSFSDEVAIPQWAKGSVEALRELGIVEGREGNIFAPNDTATRAEATVILLRMMDMPK